MDTPSSSLPESPVASVPATVPSSTGLTPDQVQFIDKFSLGGLLIPQIHLFATHLIKDGFLLMVPFYNIYVWLRGAFRGRRRSWETGEWKDFASFERRQRLMDKAALIILAVIIGYFIVLFLFIVSLSALFSTVDDESRYEGYESYEMGSPNTSFDAMDIPSDAVSQ